MCCKQMYWAGPSCFGSFTGLFRAGWGQLHVPVNRSMGLCTIRSLISSSKHAYRR